MTDSAPEVPSREAVLAAKLGWSVLASPTWIARHGDTAVAALGLAEYVARPEVQGALYDAVEVLSSRDVGCRPVADVIAPLLTPEPAPEEEPNED